jgi:hypothetical protein
MAADLDLMGEAAFEVVGRAIESAVTSATALGGLNPAGDAS